MVAIPKARTFFACGAARDPGQPTERGETLARLLRGLSPHGVSAGLRRQEPHPIDIARASYELALLPELAAFLETRDPALNGRASSRPIGAPSIENKRESARDALVRRITG